TNQVHQLTSGWNDVLALWTRLGGVARSMRPEPDPNFDRRIKFDRLVLREDGRGNICSSVEGAMPLGLTKRRRRVPVRGRQWNGKPEPAARLEGRDQEPRLLLAYQRSPRLSLRHTGQPRRAAGLR